MGSAPSSVTGTRHAGNEKSCCEYHTWLCYCRYINEFISVTFVLYTVLIELMIVNDKVKGWYVFMYLCFDRHLIGLVL